FFKRNRWRNGDHAVLVQHDLFGERSIQWIAEGGMTLGHGAADPALEKSAGHAVTGFESRDCGTDGGDFARAVRERDGIAADRTAEVVPGDDHLIAIIQRRSAYADDDFVRPWRWVRPLGQAQAIEAGADFLDLENFQLYDCTDYHGYSDIPAAGPQFFSSSVAPTGCSFSSPESLSTMGRQKKPESPN